MLDVGNEAREVTMRVADILQDKGSDVVTIEDHRTVHDAICTLNERRIGALVVTGEAGEINGIISLRGHQLWLR